MKTEREKERERERQRETERERERERERDRERDKNVSKLYRYSIKRDAGSIFYLYNFIILQNKAKFLIMKYSDLLLYYIFVIKKIFGQNISWNFRNWFHP